eukprot:CAMPEP_0172017338 /NCGR_PEP_ID=MMETSP1041-20130122/11509_1 /TAXON_ID=464988 /ORGANISM="Hemiselmis andersenii, Strain CCMP439" /LENGTH=69 /DNA_ID=CAMNT_0012672357 /DNA_START=453 /DNA_END=662 /DNA_ORIENTATION=+
MAPIPDPPPIPGRLEQHVPQQQHRAPFNPPRAPRRSLESNCRRQHRPREHRGAPNPATYAAPQVRMVSW